MPQERVFDCHTAMPNELKILQATENIRRNAGPPASDTEG
jgi:hypothetical protein|tara:strand:+ start:2061 stop:2180 length:120 start_codon:yes stop_codon:yes gene_type:complete